MLKPSLALISWSLATALHAQTYSGQARIDQLCRERAVDVKTRVPFGPCPGQPGYRPFPNHPGELPREVLADRAGTLGRMPGWSVPKRVEQPQELPKQR